jgi:hypothetical protein
MGTEEKNRDLQIIQNRAMRLILKKGPRTSVEWMLSTLQMMSVKQRVNTLVLIYKMKNSMLPKNMSDEVQLNRQVAEKVLRNRLPKYNKSCTQNTMWHNGLKLFNELCVELRKKEKKKSDTKVGHMNTFHILQIVYVRDLQTSNFV